MAALTEQREELRRAASQGKVREVEPVGVHRADGSLERARKTQEGRVPVYREAASAAFEKVRYTEDMQKAGYTILVPQMAPIHFDLIEELFKSSGYNVVLLPSVDQGAVEAGLKYVNNDICYPSILVTGQIMEAVLSAASTTSSRLAVIITQTGGGCRATNYIALIRKALHEDSGHPEIPVISLTAASTALDENNPGFDVTQEATAAQDGRERRCSILGDLHHACCLYRVRPYEAEPGQRRRALRPQWMDYLEANVCDIKWRDGSKRFYDLCQRIGRRLRRAASASTTARKPRVGVVGEILVKFHPTANNQVVQGHRAGGLRGQRARPRGLLPLRHAQPGVQTPTPSSRTNLNEVRLSAIWRGIKPSSRSCAIRSRKMLRPTPTRFQEYPDHAYRACRSRPSK